MRSRAPEPFFFGTPTPCFGCFHEPTGASRRETVAVLCSSFGRESIRIHRSFRQVADRMSAAGFGVLRFDLAGCGDSAGDVEVMSVARWRGDVAAAIEEALRRSGASSVCLIGARLGASLAALAAADRADVATVALWAPVLSGSDYLDELSGVRGETEGGELLGYAMPTRLREDIAAFALSPRDLALSCPVLAVDAEADPEELRALAGPALSCLRSGSSSAWKWVDDGSRTLVPSEVVSAIADWGVEHCR